MAQWSRKLRVVPAFLLFHFVVSTAACDGRSAVAAFLGAKEISVDTLQKKLQSGEQLLIIDIRDPAQFRDGHIPNAISVPHDKVGAVVFHTDPRRTMTVAIVCVQGSYSRVAALAASSHGPPNAYSVAGGMQDWMAAELPLEKGEGRAVDAEAQNRPVITTSSFAQWGVTVAGFGLKPTYMLLSFLLIRWLRQKTDRGLVLLRWGLAAFLAGEIACALNYYGDGSSDLFQLLHGAGMVGMSALLPWGIYVLLDERILLFSRTDRRCLLQGFCGQCWKQRDVSCGLQRIFLFACGMCALLALMPVTQPLQPVDVVIPVLGTDAPWVRTWLLELIELRAYPLIAVVAFLMATWFALRGRKALRRAETFFFWGLGLGGFASFRFFLGRAYHEARAWSDIWEEATEFVTIVGVAVALIVFRQQLKLFWRSKPRVAAPASLKDASQ
ncbi:rhodanese-like domain-containing protein [Myxococcota bacterium]